MTLTDVLVIVGVVVLLLVLFGVLLAGIAAAFGPLPVS